MVMYRHTVLAVSALLLAGCAQLDMQGVDPNDYYAAHPIKNTIEQKNASHLVRFLPGDRKLTGDEIERLRDSLRHVSPQAAESVQIQASDADLRNSARREHLTRILRSMGYDRDVVMFEPSATLARDDVQIAVTYAKVVSPDCPDWRRSPVTTYSNTRQGNFGCAHEVNLGLMVADPHDLVRGSGNVSPDSERASKVIQDYRAGKDFNSWSGGGGESASSGTSGSAVASGVSSTGGSQ